MNVLLIAPEFGLPAIGDEVRAVSLALRPAVLNGTVTRRDVLEKLRSHVWDVIWFATHGDQVGIQLSDGHVSVADLTAVVRVSGAWLVVLNTCESKYVGMELNQELNVDVITAIAKIDDVSAFQTGALLAQALAESKNPAAAYEASKPGGSENYRYFPARKLSEADETRTILMLNEWGARLSAKIDKLERRLDNEIGAMRHELNELTGSVQTAVKLSPWHRAAFVSAFMLLFLPVPLFYSQVRAAWGVEWFAALALAFIAYLFSAILWSYMWWGGRGNG